MKPAPKIPSKEYRATALREEFEINSWPPRDGQNRKRSWKSDGNWQGAKKSLTYSQTSKPKCLVQKMAPLFFVSKISFSQFRVKVRASGMLDIPTIRALEARPIPVSQPAPSSNHRPLAVAWDAKDDPRRNESQEPKETPLPQDKDKQQPICRCSGNVIPKFHGKEKCHGNTPIFFQKAPALPGLHDQVPKVLPHVPLVPGVLGGLSEDSKIPPTGRSSAP